MNLLFWGITLGVVGKLMLAIGILKVHYVMARERRIDNQVLHTFNVEKIITIAGVLCILVGYLMEIYFYNGSNILSCSVGECSAAAFASFVQ